MKTSVHPNQLPLPLALVPAPAEHAPEPVAEPEAVEIPDFAMWVGGKFYPTPQDYIDEAEHLGCSKRLPMIPEDLVVGQSKVYLAHAQTAERIAKDPIISKLTSSWRSRTLALARKLRDGKITHEDALKKLPKAMTEPEPTLDAACTFVEDESDVIFGYFIVSRLEFIVPQSGHVPDKIKELVAKGHITLVPWSKVQAEPDRGCGRRKAGGLYAAAYADDEATQALRKDAKDVDIHGSLAVFHRPFRAPFGFFRGIKTLEGDELTHVSVVAALIGMKGV